MENIFVEFLPPWIETGLQPAFYDKESGTVLQQTARMYARVNMLIRMFNKLSKNTKTTVEDYINQFNELHDYVHDYFDNLDVQEEINNKLDAMVEDGTLQEIIADYLNASALWCYDTVADMVQATNLIAGSFAKTLGHYTKEDGLGAYYKIDTTGEIELSNGLYATAVENPGGNNYYDEITTYSERINSTWCYITTIPYLDTNNEEIPFEVNVAGETTPSNYAQEHNTTLTINGVAWLDSSHQYGSVVSNGEIVATVDTSNIPDCYYYLGIKPNREMISLQANQNTAQDLINNGCEQAFTCFWRLIVNGVKQDFNTINSQILNNTNDVVITSHPRQCIGQKADKTIIILTCDGRTPLDKGLTSDEAADILLGLGCVNAWNMDGGGSATTLLKGYKLNKSVDNNGLDERIHRYLINTKRPTINKELAEAYSYSGKTANSLYNKLLPMIQEGLVYRRDAVSIASLAPRQAIALLSHVTDSPVSFINAFYTENIPHPDSEFRGLYAMQRVIGRDISKGYHRCLVNGDYTIWYPDIGLYYTTYQQSATTNIAETNTYQPVKFRDSYSNMPGGSYFIPGTKDSNNDYTEFKITCEADDRFEVSFNVTFAANGGAGVKYARITVDGNAITNTVVQHYNDASKVSNLCCTALIPQTLKDKTIRLEVYGTAGDAITRPKLSLRQIN